VKQASKRASLGGMRILLENTAGMGTCLSSRLEEMAGILAGLNGVPVDVCLDTAHLFASGYDIRSEEGLRTTIGQIENTLGLERVRVMHVNDSKISLGGRVDRHEHIGKGKIGVEAFRRILTHPRLSAKAPEGLAGRAFILETPIDEPGDDRRNVAALWELAGLKESAPAAEKGFSMLTVALKKKMDVQRAHDKRVAAAVARRTAGEALAGQSESHSRSRSLRDTGRLRRPGPVGVTTFAPRSNGAKVVSIATKLRAKNKAATKSGTAQNKVAKKSGGAKKVSGAKRKRG
jgi:hypothetical protein